MRLSGHVLVEIVKKFRGQCSRIGHGLGPTLIDGQGPVNPSLGMTLTIELFSHAAFTDYIL